MFFSAFHGSNYNVRLLPAGKDELCGYMPSLPAAARRFLICAESGKKQSRQARGNAARAITLPNPRQIIPAP
jgi:hypothetical protein